MYPWMCPTVVRICKRFAKHGLETAVHVNHPLYVRYFASRWQSRAEHSATSDYEDDLQIECASDAHLDAIVTRNPKDFAGSSLPVLTPTEFLAKLPKAPDA